MRSCKTLFMIHCAFGSCVSCLMTMVDTLGGVNAAHGIWTIARWSAGVRRHSHSMSVLGSRDTIMQAESNFEALVTCQMVNLPLFSLAYCYGELRCSRLAGHECVNSRDNTSQVFTEQQPSHLHKEDIGKIWQYTSSCFIHRLRSWSSQARLR